MNLSFIASNLCSILIEDSRLVNLSDSPFSVLETDMPYSSAAYQKYGECSTFHPASAKALTKSFANVVASISGGFVIKMVDG